MRSISFIILLLALIYQPVNAANQAGSLAIVIDDLGYSINDFQALSLPREITFSILPFTPQGQRLGKLARQQGREILLHIPMQAKTNNNKLGRGALMSDMPEKQFKATLSRALRYLPYAQGINNHMGSALTEQIKPMRWTMEVLLEHGLYFLDSRTSKQTVAQTTAEVLGVPALRRHIFLDNIKTKQAMETQFRQAVQLAKTNKIVIIIAHPYPQTLLFLQQKFDKSTTERHLIALNQAIPTAQRLAMDNKKRAIQQAHNLILSDRASLPQ